MIGVRRVGKELRTGKGHISANVLRNSSNVYQVLCTMILSRMPNIRFLAQAVLKISC